MIRTLGRRQRLAAATALVVFVGGLIALSTQPDRYESVGTYVVRAESAEQNDTLRALATLSDASKISGTFNLVAESDLVEDRAIEVVRSAGTPIVDDYSIDATVNPGTNILSIAVVSERPEFSEALATAVGLETNDFIEDTGGVFSLSVIDPPTTPGSAIQNGGPLWVAILLIVSALAGFAAAFAAEARARRRGGRWEIEDFTTRLDDESYTSRRLEEEKARSDDSGAPFSVAVMTVGLGDGRDRSDGVQPPGPAELPLVARAIGQTLRPHDHLARLDAPTAGTFAAIMPDLTLADLDEVTEYWPDIVSEALGDNPLLKVELTRCRYERGRFRGDGQATQVVSAL